MNGCFTSFPFLTDPQARKTLFLTLIFFFVLSPFQSVRADPDPSSNTSGIVSDQQHRLGVLQDYAHKQGMTMPEVPGALRSAAGWLLNGFRADEDSSLDFEVHPYYGLSLHGMRGGEAAIHLPMQMGPIESGKIMVSYVDGDTPLMDHVHGFDLHGELHFNTNLSLNTGVRQDEYQQVGDYVLLRWKLTGFQ